ncbi:hypothetical protein FB45DRAFT_1025092 [Roridomyces roridus]|uniref:Uncharacterized protein n=1 Tax=Roridomyces roridus TaxID=1738132 RepID=A0AAD7FTV6_9AGAR|nr:hypothetical protein FB45DRAFT_1025092 [Roridomyces roridus]
MNASTETLFKSIDEALCVPLDWNIGYRQVEFDVPPSVDLGLLVKKINEGEEIQPWHRIRFTIQHAKLNIYQLMPTCSHEQAADLLTLFLYAEADLTRSLQVEPRRHLKPTRCSTFLDQAARTCGQADGSLRPNNTRNYGDWPSIVIEVGDNRSLSDLYNLADRWFSMSAHQPRPVKTVVIVKLYPNTRRMRVEFFERSAQTNATPPIHGTHIPNLGPYEWTQETLAPAALQSIPDMYIPLAQLYDQAPGHLAANGPDLVVRALDVQRWVEDVLSSM